MRKAELETLRSLLSIEYETEDEYLGSMWDAVHGALSQRDAHLVWVGVEQYWRAYGPYYGLTEAKKVGRLWAPFAKVEIRPMFAASSTPPELDLEHLSRYCTPCGHPRFAHDWPAMVYTGKSHGCIVRGCDCLERF